MNTDSNAPARRVVSRSPGRTVRRINLPAIFDAPIECESTLERDFVMRAALCPGVAQIRHQPFQLLLPSGQRYTPDFFVKSFTGAHYVVEVKMADRVEEHRSRFDAAREVLKSRGCIFLVLTEQHIRHQRLHMHAMSLLRYCKSGISPQIRERVLDCLGSHKDGVRISLLISMADASAAEVLHLIATRQIAVSADWIYSGDSIVKPATETNHEVHITNWFDAAVW